MDGSAFPAPEAQPESAAAPARPRLRRIPCPTLLIWGDSDAISPIAVGHHLAGRVPDSRLEIVPGGDHDLARVHADLVAGLVARHLG